MTPYETTSFKAALRTLSKGPKAIAAAKAEYAEAYEYMRDPANRRNYSENAQASFYQAAKQKRDSVIKTEVSKMQKAIETVRQFREFPGTAIDLNSTKLQNALKVIEMTGKRLAPAEQLSIAENFRGDIATLHFLAGIYKERGLFYADVLESMTKPVSEQALDNIEYCCNSFEQLGTWPEDKLYWTQHEFDDAEQRYGYSETAEDPYIAALKAMKADSGENVDDKRTLANAIRQITNDLNASDTEKAAIFNSAVERIASDHAAAEDKAIRSDAETFQILESIHGAATEEI